MAHSYVCVYVHVIFSTKDRMRLIPTDKHRSLERYISGVAANHSMKALAVGGMEDHIHVLLSLAADIAVAKAVNLLKSNSSRWLRRARPRFAWQEGYAAFSVSASALQSVTEYIRNQAEHHKKRDFAQEYLTLLRKHGVQYDPKWVFG